MKKIVSGIMLTLLLTSMLTLAFNIQSVKAEPKTWTVDDDGPADFSSIQEAINFPLVVDGDTIFVHSGTYYENVVINKQNLALIGENKHTTIIDGAGKIFAVSLAVNNAKIEGFTVRNAYDRGIEMRPWTCGHAIHDNIVLNNKYGIAGHYDCNNISICDNIIVSNNIAGIVMLFSHSIISHNLISNNGKGEFQEYSSGIEIVIGVNSEVIYCVNNTISGNTIKNHRIGIWGLHHSEKNLFYHNNFVNNTIQISFPPNAWNNSVIENYWSDYANVDLYSGPYQNETGSDGIGDTPYIIDANNTDLYPLMKQYPWASHDVGITSITTSKTIVRQGYNMSISIMIFNYGNYTENINITIYANTTIIGKINNIELSSRNFAIATFNWNTAGFVSGNYTISAVADTVPGETDTADNTMTSSTTVKVKLLGDVNGDDIVDISDIAMAAKAFGSYPSHPRWNPIADVNSDGLVDIVDIFTIAKNFGKTYP